MESNEFICPKCEQRAIPIEIEHDPNKNLFIITQKCLKHTTKLKIEENEMINFVDDLFQSTFTCPRCGAGYPDYEAIEEIIYTGIKYNPYLILKKRCNSCNKTLELKFNNLLNVPFYNAYFKFLKSRETPEALDKYKGILSCPECDSDITVTNVNITKGVGTIEGNCIGPLKHVISYTLPLLDQYTWLSLLPGVINKCMKCHSIDTYSKKNDFKFKPGYTSVSMNRRMIERTCNDCGFENQVPMHQSLYEIYRRIVKETEPPITGKGNLECPRCNSEALLEQIQLHPEEVRAVIYCKQKHRSKIALYRHEKQIWIDDILSGINLCIKCWSTNQRVWKILPKPEVAYSGDVRKTTITLQCLDCKKKRSITINNFVYDEVVDFLFEQQA